MPDQPKPDRPTCETCEWYRGSPSEHCWGSCLLTKDSVDSSSDVCPWHSTLQREREERIARKVVRLIHYYGRRGPTCA